MNTTNIGRKLKRRGVWGRTLFRALIAGLIILALYLTFDYFGPSKIMLKEKEVFGIECLRARDLIVQEFDRTGGLWATRGMIVYYMEEGGTHFSKVAHVPTGWSVFWIRNFSLVRRFTVRPECVEMTVTEKGDICALSAGRIWVRPSGERKFFESLEVPNYGFGDQGVRNDGIIYAGDGQVYFGEYFQNPEKKEVRVLRNLPGFRNWETAYEFDPGQIRHIHAVQQDPYTGKLWICTGDHDDESMVAWTDNEFRSIQKIGYGSQQWRVCQLVFTEESVYWGTDTGSDELAGIYRMDRSTDRIEKLYRLDGPIFYGTRLSGGTIVMSSNREGMESEKDDRTRLFIITGEDQVTSVEMGTWNHHKEGFWFKFAKLRFQRNQGASMLAISCLNQKELPDGDMILIDEETILSLAE